MPKSTQSKLLPGTKLFKNQRKIRNRLYRVRRPRPIYKEDEEG